jgi:hypothetical protein
MMLAGINRPCTHSGKRARANGSMESSARLALAGATVSSELPIGPFERVPSRLEFTLSAPDMQKLERDKEAVRACQSQRVWRDRF